MGSLEAENAKLHSANVIRSNKFYAKRGAITSNMEDASQSIANAMYAIGFTLTEAKQVARMHEQVAWSIQRQFTTYTNALALSNPKAYHHVYEPNKVGQTRYKLFNLIVDKKQYKSSMKMSLQYYPSTMMVPPTVTKGGKREGYQTKKRHKFPNKAMVFEYGFPITIKPKNGDYLVFLSNKKTARHKLFSGNTMFLGGPYRPPPIIHIDTKKQATFGSMSKTAITFFETQAPRIAHGIYAKQPKYAARAARAAARRSLKLGIASDAVAKTVGMKEAERMGW